MKHGTIGNIDYISFGSGSKNLVLLPGLGDSLRSIQDTAVPMSVAYRSFSREYTIYVIGRRHNLPDGSGTRDMAKDIAAALEQLEVYKADVMGISMGGMIAQWIAIDHPALVNRLVLVATSAEPNPVLTEALNEWMDYARRNDHTAFWDSNFRRIYTEEYYEKYKKLIPVMELVIHDQEYDRFFVHAHACFEHCAAPYLHQITVPTLVIGGERDAALGGEASRKIAAAIPNAGLHMYEEYGHGLYEEAKDFQRLVLDFLTASADA